MLTVLRWLRQPTTIGGLSALVAAISALASGQLTWPQAMPIIAGAIVSIALPDNTVARKSTEAVVKAISSDMVPPAAA